MHIISFNLRLPLQYTATELKMKLKKELEMTLQCIDTFPISNVVYYELEMEYIYKLKY